MGDRFRPPTRPLLMRLCDETSGRAVAEVCQVENIVFLVPAYLYFMIRGV